MSEWIIQNAYMQTKEGLKNLGVVNSRKELNQEIPGQLAAIGEYLVQQGIFKLIIGPGLWITHEQLEKEKKEYLEAVIERGLAEDE